MPVIVDLTAAPSTTLVRLGRLALPALLRDDFKGAAQVVAQMLAAIQTQIMTLDVEQVANGATDDELATNESVSYEEKRALLREAEARVADKYPIELETIRASSE